MPHVGPPRLASTVARFVYPVRAWTPAASVTTAWGVREPGPYVAHDVSIHVTPVTGEAIERFPEGTEPRDARIGYTLADLEVAQVGGGRGTVVEHAGEYFEVVGRSRWTHGPAGARDYWEVSLVRVRDFVEPEEEAGP